MCVFHFREPSVSWYSQTASDWLTAVGAWWDRGDHFCPQCVCVCLSVCVCVCIKHSPHICIPIACVHINECMFMCAVHVHPYFRVTVWQVFASRSPACAHAFIASCEHVGSWECVYTYSWCECVCKCVYVGWQGLSPWSSALCSQRGAWLPSLYEPSVQSDRNKKPYSALGIGKTGFWEQGQTHAHTHTQDQMIDGKTLR